MTSMSIKDNDILPPKNTNLELSSRMIKRLNIGKYHSASLKPFIGDVKTNVTKYVDNAHWCIKNGVGLYIHGPNGTGKTYLASAIVKEYAQKGFSCVVVNAAIMQKIEVDPRYLFDSVETWRERVRSVHLLVIDDIGKEYRTDSGFIEKSISNLLMIRSQQKNSATIITSNINPVPVRKGASSSFQVIYGIGTANLILEMMRPLEVKGENWRGKVQGKISDRLGF